jgi:hypothetical protein
MDKDKKEMKITMEFDGIEEQQEARDAIYSNAACVFDGRFDKGLTSYGNIINL